MEAEKSHDLPSASWRPRKAGGVIQSKSKGSEEMRWDEQRRTENKEGGKPGVHGVVKAKGRKLFNKDVWNVKCAESSTVMTSEA